MASNLVRPNFLCRVLQAIMPCTKAALLLMQEKPAIVLVVYAGCLALTIIS